ncbi:potassium-transporting ATPase subunit C [Actinophytocola gossypii]|uniref:Potassium-transporting ATPase KdpC subunit n=1 Tax=Actinophytocola gossypii TaxID=2812003 RepID=A0ABT2JAH6_9PSEU|nr:potassium-transporting ATPase subunit C [Actinophytocola gossypii]MCT2584763.1 potassium-transporting ATPase subunit C [Actinophytocola gossypii]
MHTLLAQTRAGLRALLVLTVLVGVLYPLGIWLVSRVPGLHDNAEGSVVVRDGRAVGSAHIGIDPVPADPDADPWFHTRPSAGSSGPLGPGDPAASGGSNKGQSDPDLTALVNERKDLIAVREGVPRDRVPPDAVTASASGLDPHISPAYAELQVPRVARVTGLSEDRVRALVAEHTSDRVLWFLGEPAVNVLALNLAVQAEAGSSG